MEDVQKHIRINDHTVCYMCIFYCVIKHLDKSNIRKNSLFCSQFQVSVHHCTEVQGKKKFKQLIIIFPVSFQERREWQWIIYYHAQFAYFTHVVQNTLHSELCHRQSVDVPTTVNIILIISQTYDHRPIWSRKPLSKTLFINETSLCQFDN